MQLNVNEILYNKTTIITAVLQRQTFSNGSAKMSISNDEMVA